MSTGKFKEQEESAAMTEEQAEQIVLAAKRRSMERCRAKIQSALQEEGYELKGVPRWVEGSAGWNTVIDIQLFPAGQIK